MITADTLKTLTSFTAPALQRALGKKATGYDFKGATFLGITNGGQFCYSVVYGSEDFEGTDSTKVYLTYDQVEGAVSVDMS